MLGVRVRAAVAAVAIVTVDPTPENGCGVRVLNPDAAPAEMLAEFRRTSASQCQVQFR